MDEKKKAQLIAEAENIEAIKEFFSEWYSLQELYEAEATAAIAALHLINKNVLDREDEKAIRELLYQHQMMVERIKPFARKEDEV